MNQLHHQKFRRFVCSAVLSLLAGCAHTPPSQAADAPVKPPTANFERATGWYGQLAADLQKQGLPPGEFLIGDDEKSVTARLRPYGQQIERAEVRDLKADEIPADLPFKSGKQIEIVRATANPWSAVLGVKMDRPVKAGDAGLIVAYIRSGGSREANASSLWVEAKADGVKDLSDISGGRISPGPEWKLYQFPVNFKADSSDWKLELFAGGPTQVLQFGGVAFLYFGDKAKYADLPRTQYDYNYAGREADAPWRALAAARIEKYRKGDLRVVITDAQGRAVPDARVEIAQTRQAFGFGTVVDTPFFADKLDAKTKKQVSEVDLKRYRQTVLDNFNMVTVGTYKWDPWRGKWGPQFGPENTLKTLEWARKNGLRVHGHAPIWHEFGVMPFKEAATPPAQIKGDILNWLNTVLQSPGARDEIASWDAINHPFAFSGVWRDYGQRAKLPDEGLELHLDELAKYRELVPDAKLFVNEANIMTRGGSQLQRFTDYIDYLTKHKAPLDGAAFMCHFDVNDLTPPDELYRRLEKLHEAGAKNGRDLALRVTEFDVSVDPKDPKQVALQADYTRDFYTLMFSYPQTDAIIAWGFWEGAMWKPRAAWLTDDWKLRPNGQAVTDLLTKAWRTNAQGASDAKGVYATRGFKGNYKVTVAQGGKTVSATAKIGDALGEVRVVLK